MEEKKGKDGGYNKREVEMRRRKEVVKLSVSVFNLLYKMSEREVRRLIPASPNG